MHEIWACEECGEESPLREAAFCPCGGTIEKVHPILVAAIHLTECLKYGGFV